MRNCVFYFVLISSKKVKLSLCSTKHYAMKTYGEVDIYIHVSLTFLLILEFSGQCYSPAALS
jgi:hypothetical protein